MSTNVRKKLVALICGLPVVLAWSPSAFSEDANETADDPSGPIFQNGVVAADHRLASAAGIEILKQGGNTVDAAVATGFALSVVRPYASGVGGGGFMVIWDAERKRAITLDYRERAPKRAHRDMFADPKDPGRAIPELSRRGHLAVAVPGHVAGLIFALERFGTLDLKTVLAPAIRIAREGVPVDENDIAVQMSVLQRFEANPEYIERYSVLYDRYLNGGVPWQLGERFHSPQLKLLELLAEEGARAFYDGPVADAIVREMQRGNGLISKEDLRATKPVIRKPLRGEFAGYELVVMPPPSSGGVAILETLNILNAYQSAHGAFDLGAFKPEAPDYLHVLTEGLKHAFADRAEFLGDADFAGVPIERLISREYAQTLAGRIDPEKTRPPDAYGRFVAGDDGGTSHFSVMDRTGNAVACTETINLAFGSFVVEPEFGIVLNNEMDDFAPLPGQANAFGLIQGEANAVAPRKKPLSSMSPTIVLKDGQAVMALGGSGGPRIITSTLQVFLNHTVFSLPLDEAVAIPRVHHQWMPNTLWIEDPLYDRRRQLNRFGHEVKRRNNLAAVQAVSRDDRGLRGASDQRKNGEPAGY